MFLIEDVDNLHVDLRVSFSFFKKNDRSANLEADLNGYDKLSIIVVDG
jgi:hypothetical protein